MGSRDPDFDPLGVIRAELLPIHCSLLIGLGEGGERIVSQVITNLGEAYSDLRNLVGLLCLDTGGLHPLYPPPPSPTESPRPGEDFSLFHASSEEAAKILQETLRNIQLVTVVRDAKRSGYLVQPGVNIYLVGSLEELFTRTAIADAITFLEAVYRLMWDLSLSLILILPSEDAILGDKEGVAALHTCLSDLRERLAGSARAERQTVSIDYCYLIDWFALKSAQQGESVAADFVALLVRSGVSGDPRYEELKLINLREAVIPSEASSLCSGIGYSAYVLPLERLIRYCAYKAGASLIGEGLRGELGERRYDSYLEGMLVHTGLRKEKRVPEAKPLAVRLMTEGGLDPDRILSDLKKDEKGEPLRMSFDFRGMYNVPQEELVDRILSLDAFFGRNKIPEIRKQMESRVMEIKKRARILLAETIDLCISTLPNGLQTARDLLNTLSERVAKDEKVQEEVLHIPDLSAYRRDLEAAISQCPRREAVITRFFLLALFEVYVVPFIYASLYDQPSLLARAILVAGVILLNAFAAAGMIFFAESRVARAHRDFIEAVSEKYEIIIDHWARYFGRDIQKAILDYLENEKKALLVWEEVLEDTQKALLEGMAERYVPGPNETLLVEEADYETWCEQRVTWKSADLAGEYLRTGALSKWREIDSPSLRKSVCEFCLSKCRGALEGITLEGYLVENRRDAREIMADLESGARPLLRYSRLLTGVETPLRILAVTDASDTIMNQEATGREDILLGSTGDRERISYFYTIHGVALKDLEIVRLLEEQVAGK